MKSLVLVTCQYELMLSKNEPIREMNPSRVYTIPDSQTADKQTEEADRKTDRQADRLTRLRGRHTHIHWLTDRQSESQADIRDRHER